MATMRAIEQGRYLVRSANTGISGVVDPYGRVLAASPLFVEWQRTMDVRLIEDRTVYSRIGDVVASVSVLITAVALILAARPARIKGISPKLKLGPTIVCDVRSVCDVRRPEL